MIKHKWHKEITEFINGGEVECMWNGCLGAGYSWIKITSLTEFVDKDYIYRIKPKEPVYEYQVYTYNQQNKAYLLSTKHYLTLDDWRKTHTAYIEYKREGVIFLPSKREVKL